LKNINKMEHELEQLIHQVSGPNFKGHELLARALLYQTEVLNRSLNDICGSIDSLTKAIHETA